MWAVHHPGLPGLACSLMVSDRALPPTNASDQIESWLASDGDKTLGGLIDVFQERSFALIFHPPPRRSVVAAADWRRDAPVRDHRDARGASAGRRTRRDLAAGALAQAGPRNRRRPDALHQRADERDPLDRALLPAPWPLSLRPSREQHRLRAACDRRFPGSVPRTAVHGMWTRCLPWESCCCRWASCWRTTR